MSERDAFGREKGEDTLAAMGWTSSISPQPAPAQADAATSAARPAAGPLAGARPAAARPAAEPPDPPPSLTAGDLPDDGPPPRARRRRPRLARVIVPLIAFGAVWLIFRGATSAIHTGSNALDDLTAKIEGSTTIQGSSSPPPPGLGPGVSLLKPAALESALGLLPRGEIELLRVAPDKINANVVVDGRLHVVEVTSRGDFRDVKTPARGSGGRVRVDPAAPNRIARTAAKREGRRVSSVSYLVLLRIGDRSQWQLFFDDGRHYTANANGRAVRRAG